MRLRGKGYLRGGNDNEPTGGLTNLADIMLVFAVAVMLMALVRWNVDLGGMTLVKLNPDDLVRVEGLEILDTEAGGGSSNSSEESDKVYMNPKTGQMFILEDGE